MHRFGLTLLVGLLTFSASGVSAVVVFEPCTAYEQAGTQDGDCAPTCVTCGCCAQPIEPELVSVTTSLRVSVPAASAIVSPLPEAQTRDVLHVPRLRA